jgi:hypothetical protein
VTEQELRDLLDECVRGHQEMLGKGDTYYSLQTRIVAAMRRRGWVLLAALSS